MRKAFSLIELLIVILIIGVVYTMAIGNFQKLKEEETVVTMQTLKEYLQKIPHEKEVKLLCLNECFNCSIFVDDEKIESQTPFEDILDSSVNVYRYDPLLGVMEQTQDIYFNDEDIEESVCFSFSVDKKGVGDQVLVELKESVYDFSTYFKKTPKYSSLEEAIEAKENLLQEAIQ